MKEGQKEKKIYPRENTLYYVGRIKKSLILPCDLMQQALQCLKLTEGEQKNKRNVPYEQKAKKRLVETK